MLQKSEQAPRLVVKDIKALRRDLPAITSAFCRFSFLSHKKGEIGNWRITVLFMFHLTPWEFCFCFFIFECPFIHSSGHMIPYFLLLTTNRWLFSWMLFDPYHAWRLAKVSASAIICGLFLVLIRISLIRFWALPRSTIPWFFSKPRWSPLGGHIWLSF